MRMPMSMLMGFAFLLHWKGYLPNTTKLRKKIQQGIFKSTKMIVIEQSIVYMFYISHKF